MLAYELARVYESSVCVCAYLRAFFFSYYSHLLPIQAFGETAGAYVTKLQRVWAAVEANKLKNMEPARKVFEEALKQHGIMVCKTSFTLKHTSKHFF